MGIEKAVNNQNLQADSISRWMQSSVYFAVNNQNLEADSIVGRRSVPEASTLAERPWQSPVPRTEVARRMPPDSAQTAGNCRAAVSPLALLVPRAVRSLPMNRAASYLPFVLLTTAGLVSGCNNNADVRYNRFATPGGRPPALESVDAVVQWCEDRFHDLEERLELELY